MFSKVFATLFVFLGCSISCVPCYSGTYDLLDSDANTFLWADLLSDTQALYQERECNVIDSLTSVEAFNQRRTQLKADYETMVGYLPDKTSLNAQSVGTIHVPNEDYYIEKIIYESRPGHHVTANLYIPTDLEGPVPGVLIACGHTSNAKAYDQYQKAAILTAKNDMVALIFDPVCQGERLQLYDSFVGCNAHIQQGAGARLLGINNGTYEIWDAVRSLDYLISRPEVDGDKIGMAGQSGGGTQTALMMAFDDRIDVATPVCFISSFKAATEAIGPQDDEQHFSNQGTYHFEHSDYINLFAPKPVRVIAPTQDFFPIAATRETYAEVSKTYDLLGAPDAVDLFTWEDEHNWTQPAREASVQWMKQWLLDDASPVVEPDNLQVLPDATLRCTQTGQVKTSYSDEKTVVDFNLKYANSLQTQRDHFCNEMSDEQCRQAVRETLQIPDNLGNVHISNIGLQVESNYYLKKIVIERPSEVPIPALLYVPKNLNEAAPATLYVGSKGKSQEDRPWDSVVELVNSGQIVLAIDASGFGETSPKDDAYYSQEGARSATLGIYNGESLVTRRVKDILVSLDLLLDQGDVDSAQISLVATNAATTAAIHAAAIDTRFSHVELYSPDVVSWVTDIVAEPYAKEVHAHIVPDALKVYDLPDLQRLLPNMVFVPQLPTTPTVYHWKFDDNLTDEARNFTGVVIGDAHVDGNEGAYPGSSSIHFDGDNDAVRLSQDVIEGKTFTISFWAKTDLSGTTGFMLSDSQNYSNFFCRRFPNNGTSRLSGWIDGVNFGNVGPDGSEGGSWEFGVWNHHAITLDSFGHQSWYVNGKLLRHLNSGDFQGLTSELFIGNYGDLTFDFKGWIDDLQIYNWALDAEAVSFLFQNPGEVVSLTEKIPGDANGDGHVDGSDVTILAENWQYGVNGEANATWSMGDFNGDGQVDGSDVTILAGNWQCQSISGSTQVPEADTITAFFILLLSGSITFNRSIF